jgi:ankyrin repeat protein
MQILVKTMTGQTIALDLEPSDTSADVKEKIWFKESVPVRRQCLIFSGKELVGDNHIISDYITSDYNILHLVLRRSNAEYGHSIWEACAKGDLTACEYIYDVNANAADVVTKADRNGLTPMLYACRNGHLLVCKWLLKKGAAADITKADKNGFPPLYHAWENGHLSVRKWLVENGAAANITRVDSLGRTPMYMACEGGHLSKCKWLFEVGAAEDITKAGFNGATPMWIACHQGQLSVCKWLFEVGAAKDITKASNNGRTPMFVACQEGHLPVCKWLLEAGAAADITKASNDGDTPMLTACLRGYLSIAKWLFENGAVADITNANNNGRTPMREACEKGFSPVCRWLTLKGALCDATEHVDPAIVNRDVQPVRRLGLIAWAREVVAANASLRSTLVIGTLHSDAPTAVLLRRTLKATGTPDHVMEAVMEHVSEIQQVLMLQQIRPRPELARLRSQAGALELVADFLGVLHGRELRNVRELADVLVGLPSSAIED